MIVLPALFADKLALAPELEAAVKKTFSAFEPWLRDSGMPFFPGFTDHSPIHINEVLSTAASLISDAAQPHISPADVAILSMAVLLHDCGMHLTQDIFRLMVTDGREPLIDGFGDRPWHLLWQDFLGEAGRFGQDKLLAIFDDSTPLEVARLDLNNLNQRDCLLVGEFVRRHHTRIAHEIAIEGVGLVDSKKIRLDGFELDFCDISGLIARSHGMSIRQTFGYVKKHYSLLTSYRDIKIPFLMAVLRIADYIQVKSERAVKALLSVKELKSPISRQEWLAHFAVRDVSTDHDDPEALYVHATPKDVSGFLKLTSLFKDIQRELDISWGTIGEVYGRVRKYERLGLTVRRIRSNLDAVKVFAETVDYVPVKARFDSSGPDLLNLLVGPLYDYDPAVGIRELVQNGVDACREIMDLKSTVLASPSKQAIATVTVNIKEEENGCGTITVVDTGVGMSLDTITRYFLIAGASFRNSDLWKRQHLDDSGLSRVARGGRFGVGALAAYLLGDVMTVRTRHLNGAEGDGIEFSARIDDKIVELRRCRADIGTSICVKVSDPAVFESLRPRVAPNELIGVSGVHDLQRWTAVDWFAQFEPQIEYHWDGYDESRNENEDDDRIRFRARFVRQKEKMIPSDALDLLGDDSWLALEQSEPYKAIFWRRGNRIGEFNRNGSNFHRPGEIFVNGIRVQSAEYGGSSELNTRDDELYWNAGYSIRRPTLAILDPSSVCPINLQRSAVAFEIMDFDDKFATAVISDHFLRWREEVENIANLSDFIKACRTIDSFAIIRYIGQLYPIAVCREGVFLAQPGMFLDLGISRIFFIDEFEGDADVDVDISKLLNKGEAVMIRRSHAVHGRATKVEWFRGLFDFSRDSLLYSDGAHAGLPLALGPNCVISAIRSRNWALLNEKKTYPARVIGFGQRRILFRFIRDGYFPSTSPS